MGLFSFIKDAGGKIFGDDEPIVRPEETAPAAAAPAGGISLNEIRSKGLRKQVEATGIAVTDLFVKVDGDTVQVQGRVVTQEDREKVILTLGNVNGIAQVDDLLEVEKKEPEAVFYTVQSGDSLSKIAKVHYGNAMKYPVIFEANKPMLEDPDRIYPGQVLRIPPLAE